MRCPSCQHENPTDAAFCTGCGSPLETRCARCGRTSPPGSRFCPGCGNRLDGPGADPAAVERGTHTPAHLASKILRDRKLLEGERRTVTVLFADATGFTSLSEQVDPERVYDLMQGCLSCMMNAVHRYEGAVTHYTGDGVMALFGAPIAHEDSARRAVLAALDMQSALQAYAADVKRELPIKCRFRIGLHTGPVVVGKISDDLDMDYTAIGDTVNLAARMEKAAEPGAVYLTGTTYRAISDYIECQPLGELVVKGKAEPIPCYRAVRPRPMRTRFEAAAERGLTPLAGRDHELGLLDDYLRQARTGAGQVVFVSGEAGIGKSRLLREFSKALEEQDVTWLEGHCISFGRQMPYLPITDLLQRRFEIREGDPESAIIERVEAATASWERSARATVPYLRYLLNVNPGDPAVRAMDALERRAGIIDGLRGLLVEESRRQPVVAVVEDLHWIDEQSEDALDALAEMVASVPALLVLTYRPGYATRLTEGSHHNRLALGRLKSEDGESMVRGVLHVDDLSSDARRLILEKAEGNPFYIEEVTRSLLERGLLRRDNGGYGLAQGAGEIHIPNTIQEVILSRIDRLEEEAREAIQLASVIGREFTVRLLSRITDLEVALDNLLGELKKLELIYQKSYFPELAYMFKHALVHDVAYSTLREERRIALHRLIGAAVEDLFADRLADQYETLAHHYWEGQAWSKALEYLIKAAGKAAAAYANRDALAYYDRALEACERLPEVTFETLMAIHHGRAEVCLTINDWQGVVESFRRLRDRAREAGEPRVEGMALGGMSLGQVWCHAFDEAEATAREALAIADRLDDDAVRAGALFNLGQLDSLRGDLDPGRERLAEAVRLSRSAGLPSYELFARFFEVLNYHWRGRYHESHRLAAEAVETSRGYRATFFLLFNLWMEGLTLASHGRYAEGIRVLEETIKLCERMGDKSVQSRTWNTLGWIHGELGDVKRGIEYNQRGIELGQPLGDAEIVINAQINLGDCAFAAGDLTVASRDLDRLYADLPGHHEWMKWRYSQHLIHSLGRAVLASGDADRAAHLADECLALAERSESRKNVVKARRLRAQSRLAVGPIADGTLAEAEADLDAALAVALETENPPQLWKTYAAFTDLRRAQERPVEAREVAGEGLTVVEQVAANLTDEALRAALLASPSVEPLREWALR